MWRNTLRRPAFPDKAKTRFIAGVSVRTRIACDEQTSFTNLPDERIGDNALIENPMEDRGIELRLSVPVRRITLQIALDANVVKDLKSFICRVLSAVNAMNSTAHD